MPNQDDRRVSKTLWLMASKVAGRSRRQRCSFARAYSINKVIMYIYIYSRAVSVLIFRVGRAGRLVRIKEVV